MVIYKTLCLYACHREQEYDQQQETNSKKRIVFIYSKLRKEVMISMHTITQISFK